MTTLPGSTRRHGSPLRGLLIRHSAAGFALGYALGAAATIAIGLAL